jgi:hypothetical protein
MMKHGLSWLLAVPATNDGLVGAWRGFAGPDLRL